MTRDERIIRATLEAAAKECRIISSEYWDKYKHGHVPERADPIISGRSDGAGECAIEIVSIDPASIEVPSPWISVRDRLPYDAFIVCDMNQGGICMVAWRHVVYSRYLGTGRYDWGELNNPKFTHWMPLPPLPEGKDSEANRWQSDGPDMNEEGKKCAPSTEV